MYEHQTPTPNHLAMTEVDPLVQAFQRDNELTGDVRLEAAERVKGAEEMLDQVTEAVGAEGRDEAVAELIEDTVGENTRTALAVGVEELLEYPLSSQHTATELGTAPVSELGDALRDVEEVDGEETLEEIVETIEAAENLEAGEDALWNTIVRQSEGQHMYVKGAHASRIPLSLPMRSNSEYREGAIQYASGDEMEEVLRGYGVDDEIINAAKQAGWDVPMDKLPENLVHTIFSASIYEAVTRSHDPELKKQATERNSHVTLKDIWQDSTLHHVAKTKGLRAVLADGQLGYAMADEKLINTGAFNSGNLNFGVPKYQVPENATNQERMSALTYNDRGSVYIHYARPEGCFREGEEYDYPEMKLMLGGMPSTEISALMLRQENDVDSMEEAWKAVTEAGFFVPIFDASGDLVYSREDFDAGNVPALVQQKHDWLKQREEYEKQVRDRFEAEAADHGMTPQEYQTHKASQPVKRPNL